MSNAMKTFVFIISLIAYFIYLSISSGFLNAAISSGNIAFAVLVLYVTSAIGIFVVLYAQAAVKYWYASRALKNAKIHVKLPLDNFRLVDRLLVYFLPALGVIVPVMQTRSLSAITWQSVLFFVSVILIIEIAFYVNSKTMRVYVTDKGIMIRGIDLRLEIPIPSNYRNPSGYFPYKRIFTFLDLNDKLLLEQGYDLGNIVLKGDPDTLKQVKALLLANEVKQKKF